MLGGVMVYLSSLAIIREESGRKIAQSHPKVEENGENFKAPAK